MLLCESRVTEIVKSEGVRCTHVVHKSKTVTDFMRRYISERLMHHVIVKHRFAHTRIDSTCLCETPVVHKVEDIMIPNHVRAENLARAWVGIRGPMALAVGVTQ